jgi:type VI secretion system protein ImpL
MKFLRIVFNRFTLTVLALIAISAIVWFLTPFFAFADYRPFESALVRALLIAAILLWVLGRWAWRRYQAKRADAHLAKAAVADTAAAPQSVQPAGAQEVATLKQRFEEGVALLKQSKQKKSGKASTLLGTQFLYELPWYMFIGAPGSGKTTALVNSGLHFPLAERFGHEGIAGVGGTRNCDWWFTDEAVLLDTAGRYTTQESDRDADAAAWKGFLKLLAKYRPRRPVNGALVTVSVADLLQQSPGELETQAKALRARVQELAVELKVHPPIYVLVTKIDLLPGFLEFFGDASREEREQVWGTTFPLVETDANVLGLFLERHRQLEQRLNDRLIERLQQERDPQKRALLYVFPQHFSALREPLERFLGGAFAPSRFDTQPMVRGFYFTSGTQEGSPIDRIMGGLARALRLERRIVPPQHSSGKSFFITRLLNDVIFEEAGLAGTNMRWERRRTALQWGCYAAAALITVGAITAWTVSYFNNRAYVNEVEAKLKEVSAQVGALKASQSADLVELLPPLRAVREIAASSRTPSGAAPWSMRFGLYQGEKLHAAAQAAYQRMLQDAFLPRLAIRIEHLLRSRARENAELLYEGLKAYIMLSEPKYLEPKALKAFITAEWESSLPRDVGLEQRKELETHLDALLALGGVSLPMQRDNELIANARDTISRTPIAQRVYNRLKHQSVGADLPEFTVAKAGGPSAPLALTRASGRPLTRGVPGLFTYDGYHKAFTKSAQLVGLQLAQEEPWVLGLDAKTAASRFADVQGRLQLTNEVRRLYLEDYVRTWDAFLRDVKLVRPADLQQSVVVARVLSAPDSPLPAFLRAAVKEVTLGKQDDKVEKALDAAADMIKRKRDEMLKMFGQTGDAPVAAARPESIVDDHFVPLRRLVTPPAPGQPAPIDATAALMNEMYTHLVATQAAMNAGSPPPPSDVPNKIKAEAGRMPEPLQSIMTALAQSASRQVFDKTRSALSQGMATSVGDFCKKAVDGRYPFVKSSKLDITQDDFARLFAPGGLLDEFFQKNLAAYVDTAVKPWAFKSAADVAPDKRSDALVQFQRAQAIRDVFFRGGPRPALKFDLRPVSLDPSITQLVIDVDGQVLTYTPAQQAPASVQWPGPKGASQVRLQVTPGSTGAGQVYEGPWALLRMLDRAQIQPTPQPEKMLVTFDVDGRKAQFEIVSASVQNPFRLPELEQFRCPTKL